MTEQWLPVPGWEGRYEVSDLGRVKTLARNGRPERILSEYRNPRHKYAQIGLFVGRARTHAKVHILVLEAFRGPRPSPSHQACHNNGDRNDNRLTNLRWDTASENLRDKVRHGTDHNARKTHCPRNHPYSGENLVVSKSGGRYCRECHRESGRQRYARQMGRAAA